jgi:hypothetical protein
VSGTVGHRQRDDLGRLGGPDQVAALDAREVLAHRVHLVDRRAGAEQRVGQAALVGQRDAVDRHHHQRRAAARDQADQQVARTGPLRQRQDLGRPFDRLLVRHRVAGLDEPDLPGRRGRAVLDVDDPVGQAVAEDLLDRERHRAAGLAGADHVHALDLGQVECLLADEQQVGLAPDVAANGRARLDRAQRRVDQVERERLAGPRVRRRWRLAAQAVSLVPAVPAPGKSNESTTAAIMAGDGRADLP